MWFTTKKQSIVDADRALPGRDTPLIISAKHFVNGSVMKPPFADGLETVVFGLGCFWGAEKLFWQLPGVLSTAVGYAAGHTKNPTYQEVCGGQTGHNEVVLVVYDPEQVSFDDIVRAFWEGHNPTEGMRQGNDMGTQYRSGIYTTSPEQQAAAEASREVYNTALQAKGYDMITTEILEAPEFYYAEEYHQQYLAKNPMGYCGLGGTGIACPTGLTAHA